MFRLLEGALFGDGERTAMKRREEPVPALSAGLSHAVLAGMLALVMSPVLLQVYRGQPAHHQRNADASPPAAATPPTAGVAQPAENQQAKDEWPADDIARAKEQCAHVLAAVPAEYDMQEPIRKGECGLPAPVSLKSVGSAPKVVFDPPIEVNCAMVAALDNWVKTTLQPKARERFKSPVVSIIGGSGYSCRNIYNLPNARLSQHALANAVDIGAFSLQNGKTIAVLKGWGLTARDIVARKKALAEAKAKEKAAKAKADAAGTPAAEKVSIDAASAKQAKQITRASLISPLPKSPLSQSKTAPAVNVAELEKSINEKPTSEALFLRSLHDGACGQFGTVLGPEANDPHRNHFHLDLIPRRNRSVCE
jgi:hypothetical protein